MKFTAPQPQSPVDLPQDRRLLLIAAAVVVVALALIGLAILSADGCRDDSAELDRLESRGAAGLSGSDEHLVRAISLLERVEEYHQGQVIPQIMTQLGQWIDREPPLDEWTADPLMHSLPQGYATLLDHQHPAAMKFTIQDYYAISEALWMRNVARWQVEQFRTRRDALRRQLDEAKDDAQRTKLQEELEPAWLAAVRKSKGDRAADELATALHLFDWTVRNVQLDPTHWDVALPDGLAEGEKVPPPPPGAELHAWQALLLGRGDAASRARIFVLLARQQKIDAVVLGLNSQAVAGEPRPWAVGVLAGDEMYLFDPQLGLPLPGPNDTGVATLAQLRENPELLRQLDVAGEKYPVTADDLAHLVALIDATPQALSQRMLLVESKLPAEHALAITVEPSTLARRLRKLSLDESRIWVVPYRAFTYDQLRQSDLIANAALEGELAAYDSSLPLFPARMYHLRGQLSSTPPDHNAKQLYLSCRRPEREIATMAQAPELREELIARNPAMAEHPEVLEGLLRQTQMSLVEAKRQATFWLGLVAVEEGDYGTAIDFLEHRTLQGYPGGPWTGSARYNLARIYEATGQREKAIALYQADDSPQRHGSLVRARRLQSP